MLQLQSQVVQSGRRWLTPGFLYLAAGWQPTPDARKTSREAPITRVPSTSVNLTASARIVCAGVEWPPDRREAVWEGPNRVSRSQSRAIWLRRGPFSEWRVIRPERAQTLKSTRWRLPVNMDRRDAPTDVSGVYQEKSPSTPGRLNFPDADMWLAWFTFYGSRGRGQLAATLPITIAKPAYRNPFFQRRRGQLPD